MPDAAVFLDRDGTLIEEVGYASRPEQIRILGGVARALAQLADAGYKLIVVTNQSGIARGYATEDDLERFHEALDRQLHLLGAAVDAYYACPHLPDPALATRADLAVDCDCRKPKPGLLLRAAEDFRIDLEASWMVGDTWRDVAAGQAAGCRTVKLPADADHDSPRPPGVAPPTAEADDLAAAAHIILKGEALTAPVGAPTALPDARAQAEPPGTPAPEPPAEEPPAAEAPREEPSDEALQAPGDEAETNVIETDEVAADIGEDRDLSHTGGQAASGTRHIPPAPVADEPLATEPTIIPEATAAAAAPQAPAGPVKTAAPHASSPKPPPKPAPRAPAAPTCGRCGRDIDPAHVADGSAAKRHGFLLCPECLAEQPGDASTSGEAGTEALLRSILTELERMRRAQRPSSLSSLRLLAYIAQAAALFFGFGLGLLGEDRALYVQVALLLQLLVLALLLFERRS